MHLLLQTALKNDLFFFIKVYYKYTFQLNAVVRT